jgi:acetyl esterase/lipase
LAFALFAMSASDVLGGTAFHDSIYGVSTTTNLIYGTGSVNGGAGSLNLALDLYRPVDIGQGALPAASPGIVFIHGGAWQSGSKTDSYAVQFASIFASLGYVVTSINYRMLGNSVPETHGPADAMDLSTVPTAAQGGFDLPQPLTSWTINASIDDAAQAMGWMRDNAASYHIDPAHIGIGGASAGAIDALVLAYNNPAAHVAPQAVISYVGALPGIESALIQADDKTPALIINGSADPLIQLTYPQAMVDRLNAMGVYNEFYVQQGVGHTVNLNLVFGGETLLQHNIDFLATYLVPEPSGLLLAGVGAVALALISRRRAGKPAPKLPARDPIA